MNSTIINNQNSIESLREQSQSLSTILVSWKRQPKSEGPLLKNHSAVLYQDSMIIFGGYDGESDKNALWFYHIDSNTWTLKKCSGDNLIRPRNGHSATLVEDKIYIIGGWLNIGPYASDEMFTVDLVGMKIRKFILKGNASIGPSNMHTCDYYKDYLILFRGGNGINFLSDLIFIDIKNKTIEDVIISGKPPCARANHGSCIVKNTFYLFGGWNGMHLLNDLYILNLDIMEWSKVEILSNNNNGMGTVIPKKRAGAPLVNYRDEYLVLFGGSCFNSIYLNDLFFYHIKTKEWKTVLFAESSEDYPAERAGHSVIFNKDKLIIFGGGNSITYLNEVNVLQVNPPPQFDVKSYFNDKELFNKVEKMFNNPFLSDLVLTVEGNRIYCHFIILASLSQKFKELYQKKSPNVPIVEIKIDKYKYDNVLLVIKYFYTGIFDNYSKKINNLLELLLISDYYCVSKVKEICREAICKEMAIESFFSIVKVAKQINYGTLIKYCEWFYRQHKKKITPLMINKSNKY